MPAFMSASDLRAPYVARTRMYCDDARHAAIPCVLRQVPLLVCHAYYVFSPFSPSTIASE